VSNTLIIIPSFNEALNIAELVTKLTALYADADVLVVDDNSPDGTGAKVKEVMAHNPRVFLIERKGKGGRGSAVLAGFGYGLQLSYEYFIEMDADFSHKPEEIALMRQKIPNYDLIVGSRYLPGSEIHHWGIKRTVFSAFANKFARAMLGIPISDYTNGFRLYTRKAIESLSLQTIDATGYVVLSEVAMQLHNRGMRFGEIPTVFVNRRRGISNLTSKEIREAFLSVLRIRKLKNKS
jgi:dolichol-phosphate mannosyltransferase